MTQRGRSDLTDPVIDSPAQASTAQASTPQANTADIVADVALTVFHPSATIVDAGFFAWDIGSGEVICDPVTFKMHGLSDRLVATMDSFLSRVPEDDLLQVQEAIRAMTASAGTYQIEYRVLGEDGSHRSMEARGRIMPGPDGQPARMMGMVMDTTAMRAEREAEERHLRELAERAARSQDFTAALASASSVDAIVAAARSGLSAYGADIFILMASRDGRLQVVASCGFDEDSLRAMSSLSKTHPTPISMSIDWRAPVY